MISKTTQVTVYSPRRSIKVDKQRYNAIGFNQEELEQASAVAQLEGGKKDPKLKLGSILLINTLHNNNAEVMV